MYAVTDPIVKRDCEEDSDEATGAESSSDEGEDVGPGEVHSEPHPPPPKQKSCMKPHTIHHKVFCLFVLQISLLFVFLCI